MSAIYGGAASASSTASSITEYQTTTPTTGQTVTMTDTPLDGLLYLTPAGALATLTIALPTNANSRLGELRRVATTQDLTALTVSVAGGTVLNAPTTLTANSTFAVQKVAANTWIRI